MKASCHAVILLTALSLAGSGCAKINSRRFTPGQTTEAQIRTELGPPLSETSPVIRPQAHVLEYPDQTFFQIEADQLVARHREASGAERQLQHWRQRWKGATQFSGPAPNGFGSTHGTPIRQLTCPTAQTTVIFEEGGGRVLRVTEYAPPSR